jgi:hypothetical protein
VTGHLLKNSLPDLDGQKTVLMPLAACGEAQAMSGSPAPLVEDAGGAASGAEGPANLLLRHFGARYV